SANIPAKLGGTVVPPGYVYDPINYPASIQLSASTAISGPLVYNAVTSRPGQQLIVAGYSEGTLGAEAAKRLLLANGTGPAPSQLSFLMIASPFAGNGGIFERFPGMSVPFIVNNMGPATPSAYNSTYITNEYDPYADFPAYFNPLSLANSLLGVMYAHPDVYYDSYIPGTTPAIVTSVTNSAGGQDTYVFIKNPDLPLLTPLRMGADAIGLTPLAKPLLDAVEPLLRVLVDMGYTDRQNLNPAGKTPFSLFTPLPKIIEALTAIPGALQQGATNFITDVQSELHLPALPAPFAATPAPTSAKTPPVLTPVAAVQERKPATVAPEPNSAPQQTKTPDITPSVADNTPKSTTPQPDSTTPPVKSTKPKKKSTPDAGTPKIGSSPDSDANNDSNADPKAGPKNAPKGAPSHAAA
ncbi:PE-PPE domain-containing protein, partial [Mycolicibacterium sp. CBMA 361]